MKNIENKEFKFKQSLLSDTFLKSIKSESLKLETMKTLFKDITLSFGNDLNLNINELVNFRKAKINDLGIDLGVRINWEQYSKVLEAKYEKYKKD